MAEWPLYEGEQKVWVGMALRRSDRDVTVLTVLALLLPGPRHPYQMDQQVITTHLDFVAGLPRSVYRSTDSGVTSSFGSWEPIDPTLVLSALSWQLTDAGRDDLGERVRRLLQHPESDATLFAAALSFVGCLPTSEASALLQVRRHELERRAADISAGLAQASQDVTPSWRTRLEYEVARLDAERVWVSGLIDGLRGG